MLLCFAFHCRCSRTATLHVYDGVTRRPTDERVVGKHRVFRRVEFSGDTALILHATSHFIPRFTRISAEPRPAVAERANRGTKLARKVAWWSQEFFA